MFVGVSVLWVSMVWVMYCGSLWCGLCIVGLYGVGYGVFSLVFPVGYDVIAVGLRVCGGLYFVGVSVLWVSLFCGFKVYEFLCLFLCLRFII